MSNLESIENSKSSVNLNPNKNYEQADNFTNVVSDYFYQSKILDAYN